MMERVRLILVTGLLALMLCVVVLLIAGVTDKPDRPPTGIRVLLTYRTAQGSQGIGQIEGTLETLNADWVSIRHPQGVTWISRGQVEWLIERGRP